MINGVAFREHRVNLSVFSLQNFWKSRRSHLPAPLAGAHSQLGQTRHFQRDRSMPRFRRIDLLKSVYRQVTDQFDEMSCATLRHPLIRL